MTKEQYVFISYSSAEIDTAEQVRQVLAENGIKSWMAPQSIPGGSDYTKSIPEAIGNCSAFVLICSKISQDSYWVKSEVIEAINCRKTIIPYIIDEAPMNQEFNFLLSPAHRILAFQNKESSYFTLVNSLKAVMKSEEEIEAHKDSTAKQITAVMENKESDQVTDEPPQSADVPEIPSVTTKAETPYTPDPIEKPFGPTPVKKPIAPTADEIPSVTQTPAPTQVEGKARVYRSEIKSLSTFIIWALYALSVVTFIVVTATAQSSETLIICYYLLGINLYMTLLLPATIIMMVIVKKHKSASISSINKTRWLIASMFITFTVTSYLLFILHSECTQTAFAYYNPDSKPISYIICQFVLLLAFLALQIICVCKFKKGKSFFWFHNADQPNDGFSAAPTAIILVFHYLFLLLCTTEINRIQNNLSSRDYTALSYMPLYAGFILIASLLCLWIVKRHKTAPRKTIERIRMIVAVINAVYLIYVVVMAQIAEQIIVFGGYYSSVYNPLPLVIPAIVITVGIIVTTIVFRRTKYVYE